jgi:hypothetical protein
MTAYEQHRTRCNELLPDRIELKYGCEFRIKDEDRIVTCLNAMVMERAIGNEISRFASVVFMDDKGTAEGGFDRNEVQIVGKPLTIEDVLRTILAIGSWAIMCPDGRLLLDRGKRSSHSVPIHEMNAQFDLTKPLTAPENDAACAAVLKLLTV